MLFVSASRKYTLPRSVCQLAEGQKITTLHKNSQPHCCSDKSYCNSPKCHCDFCKHQCDSKLTLRAPPFRSEKCTISFFRHPVFAATNKKIPNLVYFLLKYFCVFKTKAYLYSVNITQEILWKAKTTVTSTRIRR